MAGEFWSGWQGITLRLNMLAERIVWATFNKAIQVQASAIGIKKFMMVGPLDNRTCEWCGQHVDRIYQLGQFMPDLPKHPYCRHYWDLYLG